MLALRSADSEGEWWVNQVCARRERTAAGTRSGATPPPRYTLRVVDPRVDADLLGLEWTPDPCLDAFGPVFLGTASFWIWEWFSGAIKAYEKKKKSAAFVLLSQMETHKALLLSHLEVVRFMQLWAHAQIGHSVSSAEVA